MASRKILFIMHLPPPVHGASMVGQLIHDSKLINDCFECQYINLSASNNVDEVGKLSFKKILFLFSNLIQVLRKAIQFRPALCYITPTSDGWGFYRDFLMVQLLKLLRIKVVLHFHNKASARWIKKWYNQLLLHVFFRKIKVILLGKELYAEKSKFIEEKDVFYCPNGIPSQSGNNVRKEGAQNIVRFLFLSNMMEEKGVYVLLEACKLLKQKGFHFRCDYVGGWKDITESDFSRKVELNNLTSEVYAHGPQFGDKKSYYFENADVFVFPTYYHGETFGLVLLEAMDYSLPCISTHNGAIQSIVKDTETGFCIPQRDFYSLADKMEWMILHPEERKYMGALGKQKFEECFTLDIFEKRIVSIFNKCAIKC